MFKIQKMSFFPGFFFAKNYLKNFKKWKSNKNTKIFHIIEKFQKKKEIINKISHTFFGDLKKKLFLRSHAFLFKKNSSLQIYYQTLKKPCFLEKKILKKLFDLST